MEINIEGMINKLEYDVNEFIIRNAELKKLQDENRLTELMVMQEELKTFPFGDVWTKYCEECGVPADKNWFAEVERYEKEVLLNRQPDKPCKKECSQF